MPADLSLPPWRTPSARHCALPLLALSRTCSIARSGNSGMSDPPPTPPSQSTKRGARSTAPPWYIDGTATSGRLTDPTLGQCGNGRRVPDQRRRVRRLGVAHACAFPPAVEWYLARVGALSCTNMDWYLDMEEGPAIHRPVMTQQLQRRTDHHSERAIPRSSVRSWCHPPRCQHPKKGL